MTTGPPLNEEAADFYRRQLEKGEMGGLGLRVADCRKTYEEPDLADLRDRPRRTR